MTVLAPYASLPEYERGLCLQEDARILLTPRSYSERCTFGFWPTKMTTIMFAFEKYRV
jgi:hypothetical protein